MELHRDLIVFDLETTGLDVDNTEIVQLTAYKYSDNLKFKIGVLNYFFNYRGECSQEAVEKHGITKDKVNAYPYFEVEAERVFEFFKGCDLAGHNAIGFDIPVLIGVLSKLGFNLDVSNIEIIDSYRLEVQLTSRELSSVYKRYTGQELSNTHNSEVDVNATAVIIEKQLEAAGLSISEVSNISRGEGSVDLQGKIKKVGEDYYLTFGKYKGKKTIEELYKSDVEYLRWVLGTFSTESKGKLVEIVNKYKTTDAVQ